MFVPWGFGLLWHGVTYRHAGSGKCRASVPLRTGLSHAVWNYFSMTGLATCRELTFLTSFMWASGFYSAICEITVKDIIKELIQWWQSQSILQVSCHSAYCERNPRPVPSICN